MNKIIQFFDFGITVKDSIFIIIGAVLYSLSFPVYNYDYLAFISLIPLFIVLKDKFHLSCIYRISRIAGHYPKPAGMANIPCRMYNSWLIAEYADQEQVKVLTGSHRNSM